MNNVEKVELVLIYGECQGNERLTALTYAERYPERYHPPSNYVLRLLQGLNQEGRFPGTQINQQRRRANIFGDDEELQVLAYIRGYPRSSIRHVAREVQKILKKHKMHPYKIDLVQHLRAGDSIRRLEFIAWFNSKLYDNPLIVKFFGVMNQNSLTMEL
ncbi:unnamed protein product [Macrosiphum euphorbiae]|uniref:DUF4817 domain-containing protein n=1 Tax=Macrosiphum euphorbiae TaxID=13131 RepID=A0AAV0WAF1_9HEMI|nr:unnamed protein product [Macrosiphum euphorbiae]